MSELEPRGYVKIYTEDTQSGEKTLFREFSNRIFSWGRRELAKLVIPGFGVSGKNISHCQIGKGGTGYGYSYDTVELNDGISEVNGGIEALNDAGGAAIATSGFRVVFNYSFNGDNVLYNYMNGLGDPDVNEVSLLIDYPNRETSPMNGRMFCGKDFNIGSLPFKIQQFVTYLISYEIRFDRFPSSISSSLSSSSYSSTSSSLSSYSSDSSGSSVSSDSVSSSSDSVSSTSVSSTSSSSDSVSSISVSSDSSSSNSSDSSESSLSSDSSSSESLSSDSSESSVSSISSTSSASSESSTIPWWFPKELVVDVSTIDSGELKDVYANDDNFLTVDEVTGTPGFEYHFKFHDVPNPAHDYRLTFWGYYDGGVGHFVKSQIYDFDLTTWDDITVEAGDFPDQASKSLHNIDLPALGANYWDSGDVWIKITHVSSGDITHNMYNDLVRLSISSSVSSGSSESSESSISVT